jgi:hypothetical protein
LRALLDLRRGEGFFEGDYRLLAIACCAELQSSEEGYFGMGIVALGEVYG